MSEGVVIVKVPDRIIDRTGTELTCMHHRMLISY